jgi:ribosomal-protein-alanine N-acetyltransferase
MIDVATVAHAPVLAAIHARCFVGADAWDEAAWLVLLTSAGVSGWVDEAGGVILLRRAADEADVVTLAVVPEARRRGIGAALLRAGLEGLRAAGVARVFLEVAQRNAGARALYAASGFMEVGVRRGYYADGDDAVLMRWEAE